MLVACGSALVFGFVPALRSSRVDLVSVINEDASPRGAARGRLRAGLVVAQVAVSLLLLVGAGLVTRSLEAARRAVSRLRREPRDRGRAGPAGRTATTRRAAACSIASCWTRCAPTRGIESATLAAFEPLAFLDTPARTRGDRGLRTAPRRRSGVPVEHRRSGLLPDAADRSHRRPRVRGSRRRGAAPVVMVNNTLRRTVLGRRGQRDRQAGPRRRRRLAHGDRRRRGREVPSDQRITASVLLPAVPAVVPVEHDAAHARPRASTGRQRRCAGGHARGSRGARCGSADLVSQSADRADAAAR